MGLGGYKWYQSQTPSDVLAMRLSPEGGCTRGDVASKDDGIRRGVDLVGTHINWRKERVRARTLGPEAGGL